MFNIKKILYFGLLLSFAINSCKKESTNENGSTSGYVDMEVNIVNYPVLNAIGGWEYIFTGTRNLIVYRKSVSEFMAYDRQCTYQPANTCAPVIVDVSSTFISDTCKNCNSKFLLVDGSVNTPPASLPLSRYQAVWDGANSIHVFN